MFIIGVLQEYNYLLRMEPVDQDQLASEEAI